MSRWALVAVLAVARPVAAQLPAGDSLLHAGSFTRAESVYYAAARARPHDPIARWALGRYLVSRGAMRVGATLLEEALRFGGEPALVGRDLAPVYLEIGEYGKLAALSSATPAERARARWLVAHDTRVAAPDSVIAAIYHPAADTGLGRILVRVDGHVVEATISTRVHGLVLAEGSTAAPRLHRFVDTERGVQRGEILSVADSVAFGRLTVMNYPVSIAKLEPKQQALIGIAALGKFAPTFDPKFSQIRLRAEGTIHSPPSGERLVTLDASSDFRVLEGGAWVSLAQPPVNRRLREHQWTLDAKHGQIIIER